jgi:Rieske Fe-S protein
MTDQSQPDHRDQSATRRCVLLCAGALGATSVLTACSTAFVPYDADGAGHAPSIGAAPQGGAGGGMGSAAAMPSGTMKAKTGSSKKGTAGEGTAKDKTAKNKTMGTVLGMAADIPVGGGKIFTTAKVVVTQPTKGEFKAFSAICTHVGCLCNQVTGGTINCPCHGAKFKITDGSVVTGPAPTALAAKTVTVTNGKIFLQ